MANFKQGLFCRTGWFNRIAAWIFGVRSPSGTLSIKNRLDTSRGRSLEIDVDEIRIVDDIIEEWAALLGGGATVKDVVADALDGDGGSSGSGSDSATVHVEELSKDKVMVTFHWGDWKPNLIDPDPNNNQDVQVGDYKLKYSRSWAQAIGSRFSDYKIKARTVPDGWEEIDPYYWCYLTKRDSMADKSGAGLEEQMKEVQDSAVLARGGCHHYWLSPEDPSPYVDGGGGGSGGWDGGEGGGGEGPEDEGEAGGAGSGTGGGGSGEGMAGDDGDEGGENEQSESDSGSSGGMTGGDGDSGLAGGESGNKAWKPSPTLCNGDYYDSRIEDYYEFGIYTGMALGDWDDGDSHYLNLNGYVNILVSYADGSSERVIFDNDETSAKEFIVPYGTTDISIYVE